MLSHLKVLDFSTLLPGPYATMMLADMGAHVLRVEPVKKADLLKHLPPLDGEFGANYMYLNRSKKIISVDLKQESGKHIIRQLVKQGNYDVVIEQFRPGVMQRLNLDYPSLRKINPKIIYCSITGYGQTGPYKDRAGHDNNYLALSGVAESSRRKGNAPVPQSIQIADVAGGSMHAVASVLASVSYREKTGKGQHIDVSMTDTAFALNALTAPAILACDQSPEAEDSLLNGGSYYDYYKTSDGRYFSVGSLEPNFFKALCEAIDQPELIPLAAKVFTEDCTDKFNIQNQIKEALKEAFAKHTFNHWKNVFAITDACVEPVLTLKEAIAHPQLSYREILTTVSKPDNQGDQTQIAHPIKYSGYTPSYKHTGGKTHEDTDQLLRNLKYKDEDIVRLRRLEVIR